MGKSEEKPTVVEPAEETKVEAPPAEEPQHLWPDPRRPTVGDRVWFWVDSQGSIMPAHATVLHVEADTETTGFCTVQVETVSSTNKFRARFSPTAKISTWSWVPDRLQ